MKPFPPGGPLVSVIVPSFNQGAYIRQTIDSILQQDYRPLEVLVIDGASTDETVAVLRGYDAAELHWTSEPDEGVVDAVNKGLSHARGDVVAIQSSDDYYAAPDVIRAAVNELSGDPELGIVYGDSQKIDSQGCLYPIARVGPFGLVDFLTKRTRIPQESAFVRAEALKGVGGWREEVSYAADTDFFLRIALRTKARKIERCLAIRRMHPGQRDEQGARIIRDYWRSIDTNPDIKNLSWTLRRAAAAGKYGTAARYSNSPWWKTYYLYRAGLSYPPSLSPVRAIWSHLVPGLVPLLSIVGKLRRGLSRK